MRKLIIMISMIIVALFATNCKKDSSNPSDGNYDVKFNINNVTQSGLKSTTEINCTNLKADYVTYKIDGGNFVTIPVFYVGNIPYTNSIKLASGTHILNEFIVYSDNNTPNDLTDDIVLSAAPHVGSTYAGYVTTPLDQTFTVNTDNKTEVKLDVVCFESSTYQNFGFVYFQLNELVVREQWFFGDFCIKERSDYAASHYALHPGWVGNGFGDVPAIFKVEVWRGGLLQNTFTNDDATHNYGDKVSVTYGDYKNQTDNFEFKMYILVRQGTQFNFVLFKSWTFSDISTIDQGTDGVVDFVLGNCYDPNNMPNYLFAPWMNLPLTATYTITGWNPSTVINGYQGYVDATLSNIGTGYEITNGLYASNCADHSTTIYVGTPYNMNIYSSLYPDQLPLFAQSTKWEKINWLYNHLDYFPGYQWYHIQGAIWRFDTPIWNFEPENGYPTLTSADQAIINDMVAKMNQYGVGYKVPPGGWATIIFIPVGTPPNAPTPTIQTMFIKIDP